MTKSRKVLVTGAGGFIGGWITEYLSLHGDTSVRAGVRRWSGAARIGRSRIDLVQCDVTDREQVEQAVRGIDSVIHCAYGSAHVTAEGTENVLKASLSQGIKRVIHFSTIDVYGNPVGLIDEQHACVKTGNPYGDSKIDAEEICRDYGRKGLPVVILRPTVVYGPFCSLWIEKFAERLRSGRWTLLGELGEGLCNLIYIEDLLDAVKLSLDNPAAVGETFNISGPTVVRWNEYFELFNEALNLPALKTRAARASRLSLALLNPLRSSARFGMRHFSTLLTGIAQEIYPARKMMKKLEQLLRMSPSEEEFGVFTRMAEYDISKARRILGYSPKLSLREGLEMCARWLSHEYHFGRNGHSGSTPANRKN